MEADKVFAKTEEEVVVNQPERQDKEKTVKTLNTGEENMFKDDKRKKIINALLFCSGICVIQTLIWMLTKASALVIIVGVGSLSLFSAGALWVNNKLRQ